MEALRGGAAIAHPRGPHAHGEIAVARGRGVERVSLLEPPGEEADLLAHGAAIDAQLAFIDCPDAGFIPERGAAPSEPHRFDESARVPSPIRSAPFASEVTARAPVRAT